MTGSGDPATTGGHNGVTMNRKSLQLDRRTVLKGMGVTMALPWLESLPVWGAEEAVAAPLPRRFAALFMGNLGRARLP